MYDEEISMAGKLKVLYVTVSYGLLSYFHFFTIRYYGEHGKYLNAVLNLGHKFRSQGEVKIQKMHPIIDFNPRPITALTMIMT